MRTAYELDAFGQWTGRTLSLTAMDARPSGWLETALLPPTPAPGYVAAWDGSAWSERLPKQEPMPNNALVPAVISDRQFFQQIALMGVITQQEALDAVKTGAIPAALQMVVDALPAAAKFSAEMSLSGAVEFRRAHPLTSSLGVAMGWTKAQIDQLWGDASQL